MIDEEDRVGRATNSLVGAGVIVSGGAVRTSILSPGVRIHSYADVEGSVVMHGAVIGRGAVVRNAIIDKNVHIESGAKVGVDAEHDRARFTISAQGIVVVAKGTVVEA